METKKSCTIGVNATNHGQYTHQVNAGNNTQKKKTSRGTQGTKTPQFDV
jgi:hypothetical protein